MKKLFLFVLLISFIIAGFAQDSLAFSNKTKWSINLDSSLSTGISVSNNTLIFGTASGIVYAVNKDNAQTIWTYSSSSTPTGNPAVTEDNVIIGQSDGTIVCLSISDGTIIWINHSYDDDPNDDLFDGVSTGNNMVFAPRADGKLQALDITNGHVLWTYQSELGLKTVPVYAEGFVFQGEYNGLLSMIDVKTGERVNGGGAGGSVNTPVVNNHNVYYSAEDGSLKSFRIKDVIPIFDSKLDDSITTSPSINNGLITYGTARGAIELIREANGMFNWHFETKGGNISAKPIIAGDLVFAADGQGTIFAISTKNGRLLFTFPTDSGIDNDMAYSDGVLYFGNSGGILYALQ